MMTSPSGRSKTEGKKEADQTRLISFGGSSSSAALFLAPVKGSSSSSSAAVKTFRFPPISFGGSSSSSSAAVKTFRFPPAPVKGLSSSSSAAVKTFCLAPVKGLSSSSSAAVKTFCLAPVKGLSSSSYSSAIHFQRSATFPARASRNALNEERTTNQHLGLDRVRDLRHGRNEEDRAITFVKKFFDFYRTGADLFFSANRETPNNGLPVSAPANPPVTFTTFLGGVLDIPSTIRPVLIFLFAGLLKFLSGGDSPSTFEFKLGITTKASESILTLGEAIFAYESEIIHVVLYLICYSLTWMLILPLHHGMVIVLGILLLCAPMLFLPNLVRKASSTGVRVALGSSFNMSLTGFTFTAAFGFFLIFGLVALLVLYFIWIFVRGRTPARGQDNEERRALWNVASLFGL